MVRPEQAVRPAALLVLLEMLHDPSQTRVRQRTVHIEESASAIHSFI
jgi:hypothetical protein